MDSLFHAVSPLKQTEALSSDLSCRGCSFPVKRSVQLSLYGPKLYRTVLQLCLFRIQSLHIDRSLFPESAVSLIASLSKPRKARVFPDCQLLDRHNLSSPDILSCMLCSTAWHILRIWLLLHQGGLADPFVSIACQKLVRKGRNWRLTMTVNP